MKRIFKSLFLSMYNFLNSISMNYINLLMEFRIVDRDAPRYRTLSPLNSPKHQKSKLKKFHKFTTYIDMQSIANRKQLNSQIKSFIVVQVPKQTIQQRKSNCFSLYQSPKSKSQYNRTIDSFFKINGFNNGSPSHYPSKTATIYKYKNGLKQQQDHPYSNRNSFRHTKSQLATSLVNASKDFTKGRSTISQLRNNFEKTFMNEPLKNIKSKYYQKDMQRQISRKMKAQNSKKTVFSYFRTKQIKFPSPISHGPIKLINQKELIKISRAAGSLKYQRFQSRNIQKTNYETINQKPQMKKLTLKKNILLIKQEQFAPWNIELQLQGAQNDGFKKSVQ